ncbi:MAG: hypothetical protein RLZZ156_1894 [Deinococcota bacterium]|jgi:predicted ATP-binding protein involved in virulence
MHIQSLSLTNYRGFEQLEISFHAKVNVIAGVNGVGKSSLLHALRVVSSRVLTDVAFAKNKNHFLTDEDLKQPDSSVAIVARFKIGELDGTARIQQQIRQVLIESLEDAKSRLRLAKQAGDRLAVKLARNDIKAYQAVLADIDDNYTLAISPLPVLSPTDNKHFNGGNYVATETRKKLKELREQKNLPFVVYYSPLRYIYSRATTLPTSEPLGIERAFENALEETQIEFRSFMYWYWVLSESKTKQASTMRKQLEKTMRAFLPEFTNLRLQTSTRADGRLQPRLLVDKNKIPLELAQLSDGERGLLTLVFDLTRRLALANPTLANPIAEGQAVVLIDELELHLHPSWQRQVLRRLSNTFPNCQFIVTTHSPQIIGEAEPDWVRFLEREEGKIICWTPSQTFGKDTNSILDLMQSTSRTEWMVSKLGDLSHLIHAENFVAARALIKTIQDRINGNDPELIRAETLIHFLEGDDASNQKKD